MRVTAVLILLVAAVSAQSNPADNGQFGYEITNPGLAHITDTAVRTLNVWLESKWRAMYSCKLEFTDNPWWCFRQTPLNMLLENKKEKHSEELKIKLANEKTDWFHFTLTMKNFKLDNSRVTSASIASITDNRDGTIRVKFEFDLRLRTDLVLDGVGITCWIVYSTGYVETTDARAELTLDLRPVLGPDGNVQMQIVNPGDCAVFNGFKLKYSIKLWDGIPLDWIVDLFVDIEAEVEKALLSFLNVNVCRQLLPLSINSLNDLLTQTTPVLPMPPFDLGMQIDFSVMQVSAGTHAITTVNRALVSKDGNYFIPSGMQVVDWSHYGVTDSHHMLLMIGEGSLNSYLKGLTDLGKLSYTVNNDGTGAIDIPGVSAMSLAINSAHYPRVEFVKKNANPRGVLTLPIKIQYKDETGEVVRCDIMDIVVELIPKVTAEFVELQAGIGLEWSVAPCAECSKGSCGDLELSQTELQQLAESILSSTVVQLIIKDLLTFKMPTNFQFGALTNVEFGVTNDGVLTSGAQLALNQTFFDELVLGPAKRTNLQFELPEFSSSYGSNGPTSSTKKTELTFKC